MKVRKKVLLWFLVIVIFLVACLLFVYQNYIGVSDFKIQDESSNIAKVKEEGENVTGWLRVEGTNIDLPLLATYYTEDVFESDL